ncbi:MAG TPA: putative quinol monooxygenase [Candidatus Acidoferrales bacterium]|nr:putative quinol monooxygenase [Candidatus Acidoferrales bacterium]
MGASPKKRRRRAARSAAATPRAARVGKRGVTLVVALRARLGQEAALEKELRALVGPTRAEGGCIAYDLHVSSDQPGLFLLREIWVSVKHHQRHWETEHMQRWGRRKGALLASREASFWKQIA